jgi:hypothetical protein
MAIPGSVLAALLALAGCGSEPHASRPTLVEGDEMNGGTDVLIAGRFAIVRGCIGLSEENRSRVRRYRRLGPFDLGRCEALGSTPAG